MIGDLADKISAQNETYPLSFEKWLFRTKSLKIPKRYSEAVNVRKTKQNSQVKKRLNDDQQNTTRKTKDRATRTVNRATRTVNRATRMVNRATRTVNRFVTTT